MSNPATDLPMRDARALMREALAEGRAGMARKAALVDARPAVPGEVVVTVIAGEGEETRSRPAVDGDLVVRNRSRETDNECYLVSAASFAERYDGPCGETADGWQVYQARGKPVRFMILRPEDGSFAFEAPWGETMIARPGDALVQDPDKDGDTYRIAAQVFDATYEIIEPPQAGGRTRDTC